MDYEKLGFKSGIEIHQQLEGRKLFCSCPTIISKDKPDFTFTRTLRASAGESGLIDKAAKFEQEKSKKFVYGGYKSINCLVETDDEPPHPVSKEAVEAALKMASLLNLKVRYRIQFMRKTVIDGSNTSGFQRTALIGTNGYVEVDGKKYGIESLCLEEEACQVITRTKNQDTYNLSRLGIPLLEIATAPDMKTPEEVKKVAAHIGMLIRSIKNVKRGIGSIRQDVNISIKGGARTEIKGFQDFKSIPKVVDNEIKRQLNLINQKKEVESAVRKAETDNTTSYLRPMPGADRMYPETDVEIINPEVFQIEVPETLKQKIHRYKQEFDLSEDLAKQVVKTQSKTKKDFESLFKKYASKQLSSTNIADIILKKIPEAQKEGELKYLDEQALFESLSKGEISFDSVALILKESRDKKPLFSKYKKLTPKEVEKEVLVAIKNNPEAPIGALMGSIMKKLAGKADGKQVMSLLKKNLK